MYVVELYAFVIKRYRFPPRRTREGTFAGKDLCTSNYWSFKDHPTVTESRLMWREIGTLLPVYLDSILPTLCCSHTPKPSKDNDFYTANTGKLS